MANQKRSQGAVIFDGDDTLWQTQVLYDEAKEHFFELMGKVGFDPEEVKEEFQRVELVNVAKLGFSRHRFPRSMIEVYESFCQERKLPVNSTLLKRVSIIGRSVFRRKPALAENALGVIRQLKLYYKIYLFTAGDQDVQSKRISDLGIASLFNSVFISPRKDEAEFHSILKSQGLSPNNTWMVGNSLKSDINPAVKVGLRCIWVRTSFWEYDIDRRESGSIWEAFSLDEVASIISEMDHLEI